MPMPTLTDLQGMYGLGDPRAYMQARENAGLEEQFRQSQFGEQKAQTRQRELANMYSEQDRPGVMEQQRLTNQNLGYTGTGQDIKNKEGALILERNTAMQKYKLNEDQRAALMKMTEDDFKQSDLAVEQMFRSGRPELIKQATELQSFTKAMRDEKSKHEREMEKIRYPQQQETGRMLERFGHDRDMENLRQGGRETVANIRTTPKNSPNDIMAALQSGRIKPAAAVVALNAAAAETPDGPVRDKYLELAQIIEMVHRQGPAPAGGGKLAVEGLERTPPAPLATPAPGVSRGNLSNLKAPVLPEGAKKIGTSNGKDVYQLPDGRKVIAQ